MGRQYFKYIIWDLGMYGEFPVIFPNFVQHAEFQNVYNPDLIIAAGDGEIYMEDGKIKIAAFGKSISLSTKEKTIASRPEDAQLLLRLFVAEDYR